MKASEDNQDLFYKLIREQRGPSPSSSNLNFDHPDAENMNTKNNWAKYFETLATPQDSPLYDEEHKRRIEYKHLLLCLSEQQCDVNFISEDTFTKHIKS